MEYEVNSNNSLSDFTPHVKMSQYILLMTVQFKTRRKIALEVWKWCQQKQLNFCKKKKKKKI